MILIKKMVQHIFEKSHLSGKKCQTHRVNYDLYRKTQLNLKRFSNNFPWANLASIR